LTDPSEILSEETLKIVKAIAHESRFRILNQLYFEPITFKNLKDSTGLEKSALSNNLHKLLDVGLVEKYQHGVYRITQDGKKLIEMFEDFIEKSKERKRKEETVQAQRIMMKAFLERQVRSTARDLK
jgi:DNA-binding HxlR family transcriptional regulator